jgi:NAD(P)-binding Rossmann-like domain
VSALEDPGAELTPAELRDLRRLATFMVPASAEYGVPGADDEAIFADIVHSLGRDRDAVRHALAILRDLAGGDFAGLDVARAEPVAMTLLGGADLAVTALGRAVLQCYYRDDRVMHALGLEPRPPYPRGHVLEQGDWSLLDAIRGRKRMWRDADGRNSDMTAQASRNPGAVRPSDEVVDVLIIGAGVSGAAAAWSLAETRMRILCLEQGDWIKTTEFPRNGRDWEARRYADFAMRLGWITCASTLCARSQRASHTPSPPAASATAIRSIVLPAFSAAVSSVAAAAAARSLPVRAFWPDDARSQVRSRQPARSIGHLDHRDQRPIVVHSGAAAAEFIHLRHGAPSLVCLQRRWCHALAARPIASLAPLQAGGGVVFLGEGGADERGHDAAAALAGMRQGVAHAMHPAALPRGVQHSGHRCLEPLMRIRDDERDAPEAAARQLAQKLGPGGRRLRRADRQAQHLAPAVVVPSAPVRAAPRHSIKLIAMQPGGQRDRARHRARRARRVGGFAPLLAHLIHRQAGGRSLSA